MHKTILVLLKSLFLVKNNHIYSEKDWILFKKILKKNMRFFKKMFDQPCFPYQKIFNQTLSRRDFPMHM